MQTKYVALVIVFSSLIGFPASAQEDDEGNRQVLTESCSKAGRTAAECTCYVDVLYREMTSEQIAFYADVVSRQMSAQDDPEEAAALMQEISNRRDYYREKLAPANSAAQVAMKECADK